MNRQFAGYVALLAALAIVVLIALASICRGDEHAAVCRVAVKKGNGTCYGSGTLIASDTILTCSHLFRGRADSVTVTFPQLGSLSAQVVASDPAWDLAKLKIQPVTLCPVPIAAEHSKPGESVTCCGYGQHGSFACQAGTTRGYCRTGTTTTYQTLDVTGFVRDGDSGGPMLNSRGELVGVVWGTDGTRTCGTFCGRIRQFLAGGRCGPYGCRPQTTRPPSGGYITIDGNRPPTVPVQPQQPSVNLSAVLDRVTVMEQQLAAIQATLASIKPGEQGPEGPQGPQGPEGEKGDVAEVDYARLAGQIDYEKLASLLTVEPPEIAPEGISHIVVVRDTSADYWPRIAGELERARGHYSMIEEADPPEFSVPLPQLVAYRDGTAIFVAKGARDVSSALNEIYRDTFSVPDSN